MGTGAHACFLPMIPHPAPAQTPAQLAFAQQCFDQVAALEAIPAAHRLHLATMLRYGSPARAAWWLACYLEKPGRIPAAFGTLLDLDPDVIVAAALVDRYPEVLRAVLTPRVSHRLLQMHLPA